MLGHTHKKNAHKTDRSMTTQTSQHSKNLYLATATPHNLPYKVRNPLQYPNHIDNPTLNQPFKPCTGNTN